MTDDDERDMRVHSRIELAVRYLGTGPRKLVRKDALGALLARAMDVGDTSIEHMVEAILEGQGIARADLCDRIRAVIELDEEEEAERQRRAIREACEREEAA
jgi:hypothetical protein